MAELARAMRMFSGRMSTAIQRYPSGRYGIVGSIPYELTEPNPQGTPQIPPLRRSLVWNTEQEVIDALLALGLTHFQRADCSWYDKS
jgi:hypothetical protein